MNNTFKNKLPLNSLRIILSSCFLFFSLNSNGQEIEQKGFNQIKSKKHEASKHLEVINLNKSQASAVPMNALYLVNNSIIPNERLKLIPKDSIVSVNIIKRDTIIKGFKYDTQIFVTLIDSKKD